MRGQRTDLRAIVLATAVLIAVAGAVVLAQTNHGNAAANPSYARGVPDYAKRIAAALKTVDGAVAAGPYRADWDSLSHYTVPAWYQDAKFGMYMHWGVYSVPAFDNEWYPRNMYMRDEAAFKHHIETYGPQSKFGYKDFIPRFKAEHFDANAWVDLFKRAGAKFVVPVAEHHDGFPMWDCSFTQWCAAKMGPKRDVVGELEKAVRRQGLHFGASSHRAEHWWYYEGGMTFDSDVRDPRFGGLYGPAQPKRLPGADHDNDPDTAYLNDWLARASEIVEKYHPDLVWFDWWIEEPAFKPYLQRFAAFYYNRAAQWQRGVVINYKNQAFPDNAAVLDIERGKLDHPRERVWQTDTSLGLKSWGYIQDEQYRTPVSLVGDLVDIVSKNGVLLLNVGPKPDGTIPEPAQHDLLEMGKWLAVNGEAIYGTRPWKIYGEGPTKVLGGGFTDAKQPPFTAQDIRFTTKGDVLYAILLGWPAQPVTIESLTPANLGGREVESVKLLGSEDTLHWHASATGLEVTMPGARPCDYAYSLRITLKRD